MLILNLYFNYISDWNVWKLSEIRHLVKYKKGLRLIGIYGVFDPQNGPYGWYMILMHGYKIVWNKIYYK